MAQVGVSSGTVSLHRSPSSPGHHMGALYWHMPLSSSHRPLHINFLILYLASENLRNKKGIFVELNNLSN